MPEPTFRELTTEDFDEVYRLCYEQFGFVANKRVLQKLYRECFAQGFIATACAEQDGQPIGALLAVFVHDWFYLKIKDSPKKDVQLALLSCLRRKPLIAPKEMALANARDEGSIVVVLYCGIKRELSWQLLKPIFKGFQSYLRKHFGGHHVNTLVAELWSQLAFDYVKGFEFTPINSYGEAHPGVFPQRPPCLVEYSRQVGRDFFLEELLRWERPHYYFWPLHRRLLLFYVDFLDKYGRMPDPTEVLGELKRKFDNEEHARHQVNRMWTQLYSRIRKREGDLAKKIGGADASNDNRSVVVNYARTHPWELRPCKKPKEQRR